MEIKNQHLIAQNLATVRDRMATAALRSGRSPDDVKLVAVTKYVGLEQVQVLVEAGCRDIGESRPQELWRKAEALADPSIRWHLVGHLQRNKVARTLPAISMWHSADSRRVIAAAETSARQTGLQIPVLIDVNISGDVHKHGFAPEDLEPLLAESMEISHLTVCGLMAMASREGGVVKARHNFAQLRQLRDRLQTVCHTGINLTELSMGMSGDYEAAIEEGATLVRIGSALFKEN